MEVVYFFLLAFFVLLVIIIVKALLFKPKPKTVYAAEEFSINEQDVAEHLADMVRCKTVSSNNRQLVDESEFRKFKELLVKTYPTVHRTSVPEPIGETGLLYHIKGEDSSSSVVLMSHYDVVPAAEEYWDKAPFEGIIENDTIYGRGTLDTKGTLCGIMEALEMLLAQNFVPKNDIYLAFSGDEEIAGESAPEIVKELKKRNITPIMVVDEGGAVVEDVFPGVSGQCALVGTAEKGMLDLRLNVKSKGGHASTPPVHTPVGILADAVVKIEKKGFKFRLTPPVKALFDTLGRHSSFLYRVIFANLWCFKPLLGFICRKSGGELNAMMSTTCAFTMMKGSDASNVIPPVATVGANLRIIGGETYEEVVQYLKGIINNPDIEFEVAYGMNPSPSSLIDGIGYEMLSAAISKTWREALVSPYLMFACSDSRHYHQISDYVYRFSAMYLTREERSLIHGNNECISIEKLVKVVEFYLNLITSC